MSAIFRYPIVIWLTLISLINARPGLIFAQNPSIVLAVVAVIYGHIRNISVVIDAHNAGIIPLQERKHWAKKIARYIVRHAALTLVSNSALADVIRDNGGRPFVLPDPIPDVSSHVSLIQLRGKYNIFCVASWANDEPVLEIARAAKLLDRDCCIYISGNGKAKKSALTEVQPPSNFIPTGFLQESEYVGMLYACDIVMVLTTREDCLVCGAYEAIGASKPTILSNTRALRGYFSRGVVYTNNSPFEIAEAVKSALLHKTRLAIEIAEHKKDLIVRWDNQKRLLEDNLSRL